MIRFLSTCRRHFPSTPALVPSGVTTLFLITALVLPATVHAQRSSPDVILHADKEAYQKYDILMEPIDVLSGGQAAVDMAEVVRWVVDQILAKMPTEHTQDSDT